MRTIQRVAFVFGLLNLFFGITGFIGPLVTRNRRFPFFGNHNSLISTKPGKQFGLFATNWVHSLGHIVMAVPALIPSVRNRYGRVYMGVLTAIYALLGGMGFMQYGMKPGMHMSMGMAQNREDNILHSALAASGLLFTLMPDMNVHLPWAPEVQDRAQQVVDRAAEKVRKNTGEKMPV